MGVAKSREEFEKAAAGLPMFSQTDLEAEVVCIEPVDGSYFRTNQRQRCIIRRKNGSLYVSFYD